MEQVIGWMTELNRSDHTAFALMTVLTMAGFGGLIACVIELFFAVIGIRACRSEFHEKTEGPREIDPLQGKEP